MVIDVFNKVLVFLLCLSYLNLVRHVFFLVRSIISKERFVMEKRSLLFLGMSIAYILMSFIEKITI
jgi:hypothetical protein